MSKPEPKLDEHGFPIPERLEGDKPRRGAYKRGNPFKTFWVRALVIAIVIFAVGTMLLKDKFPQIMADWYRNQAFEALRRGDLQTAGAKCEGMISWTPDDPDAYLIRGTIFEELRDYDNALADYNKAIELGRDDPELLQCRARVNHQMKNFHGAVHDYTLALADASNANRAMFLNNRAYARALGKFELEQGLTDAMEAVGYAQRDWESHQADIYSQFTFAQYLDTRGVIYQELGKTEDALADLNQSLQLVAELQVQGNQLRFTDNIDRETARQLASLQVSLKQSQAVMYEHRSWVHRANGQHKEADEDHNLALRLGFSEEDGVF